MLRCFQQPARYLGKELGSVYKSSEQIAVTICLAFPDIYEVGISHLGLQILYDLINRQPEFLAERAYLPLSDFESYLRQSGKPLCSIESSTPLNQFDLLGFSLQYELCATEVLAMLDLAQIPLKAEERSENNPLVIAGGPLATQPEPYADFFDAILIGDGEELLVEFLKAYERLKKDNLPKEKLLAELAKIKGVYIPRFFVPVYDEKGRFRKLRYLLPDYSKVQKRVLPSLAGIAFPEAPIVPNIKAVHERLAVEVMRGCVRGCRFCQAGYICRPQRERSPEEVLQLVEKGLSNSGYEQVSLLSLSTTDYCSIAPLLRALQQRYNESHHTTISFPSSRVDTLHVELLQIVKNQRASSFTIAPEAGSQRLRDVINKQLSEQEILQTCRSVFNLGFKGIKLYFMIGLPTETDQDLEAIVDLVGKIKPIMGKKQVLTVSVSGFVPKAHTPFQWAEQLSLAELERRQQLLRNALRKIRVNFRYHEAGLTVLEGLLARGDRRTAELILKAYRAGCRNHVGSQRLTWENWAQILEPDDLTRNNVRRCSNSKDPLPWYHLECGIKPTYLAEEWARALQAQTTQDCLYNSCTDCGVCQNGLKNILFRNGLDAGKPSTSLLPAQQKDETRICPQPNPNRANGFVYRIHYSKTAPISFFSHLELINVFSRAVRRSGLSICFTQGFSPHPRISFGPPLQLGIDSKVEFVDLLLQRQFPPDQISDCLNQTLPAGLEVKSAWPLQPKSGSIQESTRICWYKSTIPETVDLETLKRKIANWRDLSVERVRKGNSSSVALAAVVTEISLTQSELSFAIKGLPGQPSLKPTEVLKIFLAESSDQCIIEKVASQLGSRIVGLSPDDRKSVRTLT